MLGQAFIGVDGSSEKAFEMLVRLSQARHVTIRDPARDIVDQVPEVAGRETV